MSINVEIEWIFQPVALIDNQIAHSLAQLTRTIRHPFCVLLGFNWTICASKTGRTVLGSRSFVYFGCFCLNL